MIHLHLATLALLLLLLAVSIVDMRTRRIPDLLNLTVVMVGLAVTGWLGRPLTDALIGTAAGYIAIFAVNAGYRAWRGRDGVGLGDAKLLAGAGAWLGWSGLPFVLLLGSALALMAVAALRVRGRMLSAQDALAFGPFLSLGIFIVWCVQVYA